MLTRRTLLGGAGGFVRDPGNCRRTRAGDNVARRSGEPPSGPAALRPCHGVGPGHRQVVLPRPTPRPRCYPGSPTSVMTPLPSTGIRLGAAGTARSITIPGHGQRPHLLLRGPGAEILLNPGGGIVLPSVTDRPQRGERRRCLGLCELTLGRQRMAGADRHAQRDRAAGAEPQPGRAPPRLDGDVERLLDPYITQAWQK